MILEKYNSIMKKSERHRNRWALGLSLSLSIMIFISFAFYKGYLSFGGPSVPNIQSKNQVANVVSAKSVPSPIQNSKETFMAAFGELGKKYKEFADTISSVLVPFITGIEVYEKK